MLYLSKSRDDDDIVYLTRADDAVLEVNFDDEYELGETEYFIFSLRQKPSETSELLLNIESIPGNNRIVFNHADTKDLNVGAYSAEVQLMTSSGKRITVWPRTKGKYAKSDKLNRRNFYLMPEVVLE